MSKKDGKKVTYYVRKTHEMPNTFSTKRQRPFGRSRSGRGDNFQSRLRRHKLAVGGMKLFDKDLELKGPRSGTDLR
jgi:hypothetical protein